MSEADLKCYVKVVEANNTALTQHFIKQLLKLEEKVNGLKVELEDLRDSIRWLEQELKELKQ